MACASTPTPFQPRAQCRRENRLQPPDSENTASPPTLHLIPKAPKMLQGSVSHTRTQARARSHKQCKINRSHKTRAMHSSRAKTNERTHSTSYRHPPREFLRLCSSSSSSRRGRPLYPREKAKRGHCTGLMAGPLAMPPSRSGKVVGASACCPARPRMHNRRRRAIRE